MPKRVDTNQKAITAAMRSMGASVLILSMVGKGCPDILVGLHNKNYLIEIKNGALARSAQRLTEHEQNFFDNWRGDVRVLRSVEEAIEFINSLNQ